MPLMISITHFLAFQGLGASIDIGDCYHVKAKCLMGSDVFFDEPSVTATENAIMAAEANAIERAVDKTLRSGFRCGDIMQENCQLVGCKAMGAEIRSRI